jgi:bacitracin transport system permease protein
LITPFNTGGEAWLPYASVAEVWTFRFVGTIAFILLSSHIFLREYSYDTVKLIYSYPISKISIFISKLLTVYIIIALIYILHFTIVFGGGLLMIHKPLTEKFLLSHAAAYIISMILEFAIIPLIIFLINIFKNTTASIFIAIVTLFSNFYISETKWYSSWPLLLPYIPMMKLEVIKFINLIPAVKSGVITAIIGMSLCIFQLSRLKDV